jgi:hypothetical protein
MEYIKGKKKDWYLIVSLIECLTQDKGLISICDNKLKVSGNARVEIAKFVVWLYNGLKEHETKHNQD